MLMGALFRSVRRGRRGRSGISDENVRCVVAAALADLDGRAAVTWLLRLVDDSCPAIRRMVADALAVRDDPRKVAALRRLTNDADTEVGKAAMNALRASCR